MQRLLINLLSIIAFAHIYSYCNASQNDEESQLFKTLALKLTSNKEEERKSALRGFAKLGPNAKGAINEILSILAKDPYNQDAIDAIASIGEISIPELFRNTDSQQWQLRYASISALGTLRLKSNIDNQSSVFKLIEKTLIDKIDDSKEEVGTQAIVILFAKGPYSDRSISKLIEIIRNRSNKQLLRLLAISSFQNIGIKGKEGIPNLIAIVKDKTSEPNVKYGDMTLRFREAACRSLDAIDPANPVVTDVLVNTMKDRNEDKNLRLIAASVLSKRADKGKLTIQDYLELLAVYNNDLSDNGILCKSALINTMQYLGDFAKDAIPELKKIEANSSDDAWIARMVRNTIRKIEEKKENARIDNK